MVGCPFTHAGDCSNVLELALIALAYSNVEKIINVMVIMIIIISINGNVV